MLAISTCFSAYTRPLSLRTALYTVPNDPFAIVTSFSKSESAIRLTGAAALPGAGDRAGDAPPRCDCDNMRTPEPTLELLVRYISASREGTQARAS